MTKISQYQDMLEEGTRLLDTFTISYPYGIYKDCRYSSTYDGMTRWLNGLLTMVAESEPLKKEDPLYILARGYRGKIGNLDCESFKRLLQSLKERCPN